ncbi:MAG: sugar ABC transporter permease [Clostridia bacterium]|nr:sugar ABC transporter permease [Clostridia bacterium]
MEEKVIGNQIKKKFPWKERIFIWALLAYPLIQLAIFYFYVNISAFTLAFKELNVDMSYKWVGFDNFVKVWADFVAPNSQLMTAFFNSIIKWLISFTIRTPMVFLLSYYVYKRMPGALFFRIVAMLPTIISSFVISLIFKSFMSNLPKLLATYGVQMPNVMAIENSQYHFGVSVIYAIWLSWNTAAIVYPNRMNSIDGSLIESAQLEGCSLLQELWYIIIPMLIPTFTTYTVLGVSGIFSDSGPLFALWSYRVAPEASNIGYFIFNKTTNTGGGDPTLWYSYVAALGLMTSVISVPLTFGVKKILEKADPMND